MPVDVRELKEKGQATVPPCPRCGGLRHVSLDKGVVVRTWDRRHLHEVGTVRCSRCKHVYSYDTRTGKVIS